MELALIGLWLLAVGVSDLLRATGDVTSPERRLATLGTGAVVLGVGLAALDVERPTRLGSAWAPRASSRPRQWWWAPRACSASRRCSAECATTTRPARATSPSTS